MRLLDLRLPLRVTIRVLERALRFGVFGLGLKELTTLRVGVGIVI